MSVSSINYSNSVLGQSVQNLNNQLTNLSTQLSTGVKSQTYSGMGGQRGICDRRAGATLEHHGPSATPSPTSARSFPRPTPRCRRCRPSADKCRAVRRRRRLPWITPDKRPPRRARERIVFPRGHSQYPGRRSLYFLRQRDQHAGGRLLHVDHERQRDRRRTEAGHQRTAAGRSRNQRHGTGERHPADYDVSAGRGRRRRFTVRAQAEFDLLDIDRRRGDCPNPGRRPPMSVALGATNPNPGDQVSFEFNLPDGTTQTVQLTATNTTAAADRQLHHREHAGGRPRRT